MLIPFNQALSLGALILVACQHPTKNSAISQDENRLSVQFAGLSVAGSSVSVDSAVLEVRATGQATTRIAQAITNQSSITAEHIPAGSNRTVELSLYNRKGLLLYRGDTTLSLSGGETSQIALRMVQQFGSISAKVPLPLNGNTVSGGELRLIKGSDTLKTSLSGNAGSQNFNLSPIAIADGYQIQIALWNSNRDTLYNYSGSINVRSGTNQSINIKLNSLYASLVLSMELQASTTQELGIELPGARLRSPNSMGEMVFSEIMPNPGVSADSLEWIELYNASSDTLDLQGCAIRKTRSSTSATTNFWIDSTHISSLAPGRTLVLGREKVSFAQGNYHGFTMTNSGQDLLILCKGALIDSLSYSDSKFPYLASISMQLDLSRYSQRLDSASWCAGNESHPLFGLNLQGSPGSTPSCTP